MTRKNNSATQQHNYESNLLDHFCAILCIAILIAALFALPGCVATGIVTPIVTAGNNTPIWESLVKKDLPPICKVGETPLTSHCTY